MKSKPRNKPATAPKRRKPSEREIALAWISVHKVITRIAELTARGVVL
jgi:hypothetical protein